MILSQGQQFQHTVLQAYVPACGCRHYFPTQKSVSGLPALPLISSMCMRVAERSTLSAFTVHKVLYYHKYTADQISRLQLSRQQSSTRIPRTP